MASVCDNVRLNNFRGDGETDTEKGFDCAQPSPLHTPTPPTARRA